MEQKVLFGEMISYYVVIVNECNAQHLSSHSSHASYNEHLTIKILAVKFTVG